MTPAEVSMVSGVASALTASLGPARRRTFAGPLQEHDLHRAVLGPLFAEGALPLASVHDALLTVESNDERSQVRVDLRPNQLARPFRRRHEPAFGASFALGDAVTKKVMMKHTVCACAGLPRQDLEFFFEFAGTKSLTTLMIPNAHPMSRLALVVRDRRGAQRR
jgi:hypothetical protein